MNPTDDRPMAELMALIGHALQSHPLMEEALTHASYRNEHRDLCADNERLEFLGDSILGAAVSHLLSIAYPEAPEGVLTRYKAVLVSEPGLADMARTLGSAGSCASARARSSRAAATRAPCWPTRWRR